MNPTNDNHGLERPGFLLILTLALGLIGGVALDRLAVGGIESVNSAADFRLISEAWRIVREVYAKELLQKLQWHCRQGRRPSCRKRNRI